MLKHLIKHFINSHTHRKKADKKRKERENKGRLPTASKLVSELDHYSIFIFSTDRGHGGPEVSPILNSNDGHVFSTGLECNPCIKSWQLVLQGDFDSVCDAEDYAISKHPRPVTNPYCYDFNYYFLYSMIHNSRDRKKLLAQRQMINRNQLVSPVFTDLNAAIFESGLNNLLLHSVVWDIFKYGGTMDPDELEDLRQDDLDQIGQGPNRTRETNNLLNMDGFT